MPVLFATVLSGCGVEGEGGGGSDSDAALLAFLNQLIDSDDNPPPESVAADLFADRLELFAGRGYDRQPDEANDDVADLPLMTSPQTVTLDAFTAGDAGSLLAQGSADLTRGDLFLAVALGDITIGDPAAVAAPTIRIYRIEPDERVLVNERVRFRVIHALAGSPDPATLTVPDQTVEDFALGDASDYFLAAGGATLTVTLDGVTISCPVDPGGNYEAIIAHAGFDIADEDSVQPALFCHPVLSTSAPVLGR